MNNHSLAACRRTCIKDTTDGSSSRLLACVCCIPSVSGSEHSTTSVDHTSLQLGRSLGETSPNMRGARCCSLFIHPSSSSGTVRQDIFGYDSIDTSHRMATLPVGGRACHICLPCKIGISRPRTAQTTNRWLSLLAHQARILRCKRLWGQYDKSSSRCVTPHELFAGPPIRDEPSAARVRQEEAAICCSRLGPAAVRWGFCNPDRSFCWVPADAGSRRKPVLLRPAASRLSRPSGLNRRYVREPLGRYRAQRRPGVVCVRLLTHRHK